MVAPKIEEIQNWEINLEKRLKEHHGELIAKETVKVLKSFKEETDTMAKNSKDRIKEIEEKLENDIRKKMVPIVVFVITVVLAGVISIMYIGTKDVNNSVISLQKDIISAQDVIRKSTNELQDANSKLISAKTEIADSKNKLNKAIEDYNNAKTKYDSLAEEVKSKLESLKTITNKSK